MGESSGAWALQEILVEGQGPESGLVARVRSSVRGLPPFLREPAE